MKVIRSQRIIDAAEELHGIIAQRKALEKREKELKELFKVEVGDDKTAKAGPYVIVVTDCTTSTLHRDRLTRDMGLEFVEKYLVVTAYKKVDVKA